MAGFFQEWNSRFEFRNSFRMLISGFLIILIFKYLSQIKNQVQNPNIVIALELFYIFLYCLFFYSIGDWIYQSGHKGFGDLIFATCISIFAISILIANFYNDSNVMVACATIILVIVTGYGVVQERKFKIKPIIALGVKENDITPQVIDLIIENVGQGIAKNIKFDIQPPGFTTLSGDPLEKLFYFRDGIKTFSPNQKVILHLTNLNKKIYEIKEKYQISDDHDWREKLKNELELTFYVKYENIDGDKDKEEFKFNLCVFWGLRYPVPPDRNKPLDVSFSELFPVKDGKEI